MSIDSATRLKLHSGKMQASLAEQACGYGGAETDSGSHSGRDLLSQERPLKESLRQKNPCRVSLEYHRYSKSVHSGDFGCAPHSATPASVPARSGRSSETKGWRCQERRLLAFLGSIEETLVSKQLLLEVPASATGSCISFPNQPTSATGCWP